jgi:hypothetical protein
MAKALQPAVTAGSIFFELDRFDSSEGDRLELSGRWFGVRGRRFMRPSLVLIADGGSFRALADLAHKPWAAEDGQRWEAAFPWSAETELLEAELSVAPDITVRLPAPSPKLDSAQRLAALPREANSAPSPERPERRQAAASAGASKKRAQSRSEVERLRGELETTRSELEAVRGELESMRGELEDSQAASAEATGAVEAANLEASAAIARRDAAVSSLDQAIAERDAALSAKEEANAEHVRAVSERDQARESFHRMKSEFEQARAAAEQAARELEAALEGRDRAIGERDALLRTGERLAQERNEAISARGAALVMRNAARAIPSYERHAGWVKRGVAIVVLLGAVFALLVILHVL